MGDSRDLCPHLDSIGEVTKDDLLLKSKVKGQTSWGSGLHFRPLCWWGANGSAAVEMLAPDSVCLSFCANGRAGVCLGAVP